MADYRITTVVTAKTISLQPNLARSDLDPIINALNTLGDAVIDLSYRIDRSPESLDTIRSLIARSILALPKPTNSP